MQESQGEYCLNSLIHWVITSVLAGVTHHTWYTNRKFLKWTNGRDIVDLYISPISKIETEALYIEDDD